MKPTVPRKSRAKTLVQSDMDDGSSITHKFGTQIFKQKELNKYNYINYKFSSDCHKIPDDYIEYAELHLERKQSVENLFAFIQNKKIASHIEFSIFEFTLKFCVNNKYSKSFIEPVYKDKLNNILSNIDVTNKVNNQTFLIRILNNEFNNKHIAFMSPSQIFPKLWEMSIKKKEYKEQQLKSI